VANAVLGARPAGMLDALVTPLIAVRAMVDDPRAPA
jgi:hypothetical protein